MADPILKINGIKINYEPNSFKFEPGSPSVNFYPDTGGEVNVTEDISTAVSMVSFDLRTSGANRQLFDSWKSKDLKAITFTDEGENTSISGARLSNPNVQIPFGSDATFTVEFKGNPAV